MTCLCRAGLLLTVATALAAAPTYETYENQRFGYRVDYPTFLTPQPEAQNGDGRRFTAGDGKIVQTVWGSNNALDESLADKYRAKLRELKQAGHKVDYQVLRETFYVVSWQAGRIIGYERCAVSREDRAAGDRPAQFATVKLAYDHVHRTRMNAVVTHVSKSLVGPEG